MEACDNSFDLERPLPLERPQRPTTQLQNSITSRQHHPSAQRRGQWLSSSSSSFLSHNPSDHHRMPIEHIPLQHQPYSYPQSHTNMRSYQPDGQSYRQPRANRDTNATAPSPHAPLQYMPHFHHHHQHQQQQLTGQARSHEKSSSASQELSTSSFTNVEEVTRAIRNKVIVEEDEEDILSTDQFY